MMNIQILPPKMAIQFADRARRGEADNEMGCEIFQFFQGNNVVTVIGLQNPTGHIEKISTNSMALGRAAARPGPNSKLSNQVASK